MQIAIVKSASDKPILQGLVLFIVMLLMASDAVAVLGKSSIKASAPPVAANEPGAIVKIQAATLPLTVGAYTVDSIQLASGTVIKEYLSPAGVVFAISWVGPVLPDLRFFLGDYFDAFKLETERARVRSSQRSPVHLKLDTLVVNSSGKMGAFFGTAFAPALVPLGVDVKEILN